MPAAEKTSIAQSPDTERIRLHCAKPACRRILFTQCKITTGEATVICHRCKAMTRFDFSETDVLPTLVKLHGQVI